MKTITANIPARTVSFGNQKRTYPARVDTFTQDEKGAWIAIVLGNKMSISEAEVIDTCLKATNWKDIKAQHFPMHGFHN